MSEIDKAAECAEAATREGMAEFEARIDGAEVSPPTSDKSKRDCCLGCNHWRCCQDSGECELLGIWTDESFYCSSYLAT